MTKQLPHHRAQLYYFSWVARNHPTKGYQWWHPDALEWVTGGSLWQDRIISWKSTWAEPEAEE